MNESDSRLPTDCSQQTTEVSLLRRWSERKLHTQAELSAKPPPAEPVPQPVQELTDADMPPLDSLDENSDYSLFFSPQVSQELRRLALRKLFHSPVFNVSDGLNDYSEDYTRFAPLGDIVTQEMRHRMAVEARRLSKALLADVAQATETDTGTVQTAEPDSLEPAVSPTLEGMADERGRSQSMDG